MEEDYIRELAADIAVNGLREPVRFRVSKSGSLCLRNGHHRLLAAELVGLRWLPYLISGHKYATEVTYLPLVPTSDFDWWLEFQSRSARFSTWI